MLSAVALLGIQQRGEPLRVLELETQLAAGATAGGESTRATLPAHEMLCARDFTLMLILNPTLTVAGLEKVGRRRASRPQGGM